MKKECIKCFLDKDLSKFHLNNTSVDGRRNVCYNCVSGKIPKFKNDLQKNLYEVAEEVRIVNKKDKEYIDKLIGRLGSMKAKNYKIHIIDRLIDAAYAKLDKSLAAGNPH